MALIQCAECKREVSDQAAACPHCGAPVRSATPPQFPPTPRTSGCRVVVGVVLGLLLLLFLGKACTHTNPDGEVVPDSAADATASSAPPAAAGSLHVISNTCEKDRFGYTTIAVTVQNDGTTDIPFAKMFVEFTGSDGAVIAKDTYFNPTSIPPGARASADATIEQSVKACVLRAFQAQGGTPVTMQ